MSKSKKTASKSGTKPTRPAKATEAATAVDAAVTTDAAANTNAVNPDLIPPNEAMKPAKAKKGTEAKAPTADQPKKTSGLDAAARVLKDAGQPMHCKDMVAKMLADGLWTTDGKTPSATIYSAMHREIKAKGTESRFAKTDRGLFTVNAGK